MRVAALEAAALRRAAEAEVPNPPSLDGWPHAAAAAAAAAAAESSMAAAPPSADKQPLCLHLLLADGRRTHRLAALRADVEAV